MRKKSKKRTILSILLSFLLTLCFLCLMVAVELSAGFVGKRNLRSNLVVSNYIRQAQEDVANEVADILEKNHLDRTIAEELLTYDRIYLDFSFYIDSIFRQIETESCVEQFGESLQREVNSYLTSHKVTGIKDQDAAVDKVVTLSAAAYENYVTPSFVTTIYDLSLTLTKTLKGTGTVSAIIAVLIVLLLLAMYHYKHHAINYVIYSIVAAAIVNAAGAKLILTEGILADTGVGPVYYIELMQLFIKNCKKECLILSAICIIPILVLALINRHLRKSR